MFFLNFFILLVNYYMNDYYYLYNYSTNKKSTFYIDTGNFEYPVKSFYTSQKLKNVEMYINDIFISKGICIKMPHNNLYKIVFFKGNSTFDFHLLESNSSELYFVKSCCKEWGTLYFENDTFIDYTYTSSLKYYTNMYNETYTIHIDNKKINCSNISYLN